MKKEMTLTWNVFVKKFLLIGALLMLCSLTLAMGTTKSASAATVTQLHTASAQTVPMTHQTGYILATSCQGTSASLVIEGTDSGHVYDCSGDYTLNVTTYFLSAGGWSGYISRADGTWLFCDGQQFSMPFVYTYSIYLSPTKESWC